MAAAQSIEEHRAGAEVHTGHAVCAAKARELLAELGLPDGLLPLPAFQEVGYNGAAGFVWLRQSGGGVTHDFDAVGKRVWYAAEVTAMVERGRMRGLTGVKSKELLIWVTISEIVVSPSGGKVVFRSPAGLARAFPVSAFQLGLPEAEKKTDAADEPAAAATN